MLYIGADHRGFELKEELKSYLEKRGINIEDKGAYVLEQEDDYVDFAKIVAEEVARDPEKSKGILICGSGHGMDMVANKFDGIRAALCFNTDVAKQSREHEDANVLVIPSDWADLEAAKRITDAWLQGKFSGEERHVRRLKKIRDIESKKPLR